MKAKRYLVKKTPMPKLRVPSALEAAFMTYWRIKTHAEPYPLLPDPWPEFVFDSERNWRFDFAWPHCRVAVELDGGQWSRGRTAHAGGRGQQRDCEKSNAANLAGWCLLRYTPTDMKQRPLQVVEEVAQAIVGRSQLDLILSHGR